MTRNIYMVSKDKFLKLIGLFGASSILALCVLVGGNINLNIQDASANNFSLSLNQNNKPSEASGHTSSDLTGEFTTNVGSGEIEIKYNKVYESSNGNVSLGIGGSISSSTSSAKNISDISTIKIDYTSTSYVWLRYGFVGEDHQFIAESGKTYSIYGNWFQIRNTDITNIEDVNVTITYPCGDDASPKENAYFEESFNNSTFDKSNLSFDELCSIKDLVYSFDNDNGTIELNMFQSKNESNRYLTMMNTINKFSGEYSVSFRVKYTNANTKRIMVLLGKDNYKTNYSNILKDHSLGTSIEINSIDGWVRANGTEIANGVLSLNPQTQFVTYTLKTKYLSKTIEFYENDVLKATFDDEEYIFNGYISLQAASLGEACYSLQGFGIEIPGGNSFDYSFESGTIGNGLIFYPRSGSSYYVDKGNLNVTYSNDNLATSSTYDDVTISVKYKNTTDGRLTIVFGATNPSSTGYRPGGQSLTTGLVSVLLTPTFARVYNESAGASVTQNEAFGGQSDYAEATIIYNGSSMQVWHNGETIINTKVANVKDGQIVFAAGGNPATINYSSISLISTKGTGLLDKKQSLTIPANSSKTIEINANIGSNNYIQLLTEANNHFAGKFVYHSLSDYSIVQEEDFYIEKSDTETDFRQFLDAYRTTINSGTGKEMSCGNFAKFFESIVITNITNSTLNVNINSVFVYDDSIPSFDKMVYLEKDGLKVGMDLATGGTLSYLEKTTGNVKEVLNTSNFNVQIGPNKSGSYSSSHVNLINIYDTGRQIQQSYYASIGGNGGSEESRRTSEGNANGYTRKTAYTASSSGFYWPYNPVQGGDEIVNVSQIIDYRVTEDELYCKTRSLDWAAGSKGVDRYGNRVSKSYTENWFKIVDGVLQVKNRFIDWNGFTDMDSIPSHNLEIPATYIAHPLHNYYAYVGDNPFSSTEMSSGANLDIQSSLGSWASGSYKTTKHLENWFAWLNDDADPFGVAVYIPGTGYYASGRSNASVSALVNLNYGANNSPMVNNLLYNKTSPNSTFTSCYVRNTSYTAPVINVKMKEYIPLEYEYAIAVDTLSSFRQIFKGYYQQGKFANTTLKNWD